MLVCFGPRQETLSTRVAPLVYLSYDVTISPCLCPDFSESVPKSRFRIFLFSACEVCCETRKWRNGGNLAESYDERAADRMVQIRIGT